MQLSDWNGLSADERDSFVNSLVEYGTDFVAPLYSVVEKIEETLQEKNSTVRAQADARPFGWWYSDKTGEHFSKRGPDSYAPGDLSEYEVKVTPLYTHPEASAPGLSDEEILKVAAQFTLGVGSYQFSEHRLLSFVRHLTRASAATVADPSDRRHTFEVAEVSRGNDVTRDGDGHYVNQFVQDRWEDFSQQQAEPVREADYCTESNCRRCNTPKALRTPDMDHAGLGSKPKAAKQQAGHVGQACGDSAEHVGIQQAEPGADERAAFEEWLVAHPYPITWRERGAFFAGYRAAQSGQRAGVAEDAERYRKLCREVGNGFWGVRSDSYADDPGNWVDDKEEMDRLLDALPAAPTQQQEGGK